MKKAVKIISLLLVVTIAMSVFLTIVFADAQPSVFSFQIISGKAHIIGYSGTEDNLVIPGQIKATNSDTYYTVSGISFNSFDSETEFSSITIPATVKEISFNQDILCKKYIVDSQNTVYKSVDGVLYNKDMAKLIKYPCLNSRKTFTVPADVIMIAPRAFKGCVNLETVSFEGIVKRIGKEAFSGCVNLETVENIYVGLASVGSGSFDGCEKLNSSTAVVLSSISECCE